MASNALQDELRNGAPGEGIQEGHGPREILVSDYPEIDDLARAAGRTAESEASDGSNASDDTSDHEDSETDDGTSEDRWAFLFSELESASPAGNNRVYTDADLLDPTLDDEDFLPFVPGSSSGHSPNEDQRANIAEDPLFQRRSNIIPSAPENDEDSDDEAGLLPPAFDEPAVIRNIYIRVFIGSAFDGTTHRTAAKTLLSHKLALSAIASPALLFEVQKMAVTLRTVERRLGVSPDQHITFYFVCPTCYAIHHPETLYKLTLPKCQERGCDGALYSTANPDPDPQVLEDDADDADAVGSTSKRTPTKIMPYASLLGYLRRLLRRPGKLEEINHWRKNPEDKTLFTEPIPDEEWSQKIGSQHPLQDIYDGSAWRSATAFLQRNMDEANRRVVDSSPLERPIRFVSFPYPLMFQFNIDW